MRMSSQKRAQKICTKPITLATLLCLCALTIAQNAWAVRTTAHSWGSIDSWTINVVGITGDEPVLNWESSSLPQTDFGTIASAQNSISEYEYEIRDYRNTQQQFDFTVSGGSVAVYVTANASVYGQIENPFDDLDGNFAQAYASSGASIGMERTSGAVDGYFREAFYDHIDSHDAVSGGSYLTDATLRVSMIYGDGDSGSIFRRAFAEAIVSGENINPVPLPAAAWLFISGLVGVAGFSRWKHKKA